MLQIGPRSPHISSAPPIVSAPALHASTFQPEQNIAPHKRRTTGAQMLTKKGDSRGDSTCTTVFGFTGAVAEGVGDTGGDPDGAQAGCDARVTEAGEEDGEEEGGQGLEGVLVCALGAAVKRRGGGWIRLLLRKQGGCGPVLGTCTHLKMWASRLAAASAFSAYMAG